jgi:hypothetical protein
MLHEQNPSASGFPIDDALSCQEFVARVTVYLEGVLPPEESLRFTAHLAGCLGCATYLDQIRRTIELTRRLGMKPRGQAPLSQDTADALLRAYRGWRRE